MPENDSQFLQGDGLKGARLGVFRRHIDTPEIDPEGKARMQEAIQDL